MALALVSCAGWRTQRALIAFVVLAAAVPVGLSQESPSAGAGVALPPAIVLLSPRFVGDRGFDKRTLAGLKQQHLDALAAAGTTVLGELIETQARGAYAGTRRYARRGAASDSAQAPSLVVGSYLLIGEGGVGPGRIQATIVLVAEAPGCYLRAARIVPSSPAWSRSESLPAAALQDIKWPQVRAAASRSPVRLVLSGSGQAVLRAGLLHEAAAAVRADAGESPIQSGMLLEACSTAVPPAAADLGYRAHRDLLLIYGKGTPATDSRDPAQQLARDPLGLPPSAPHCELRFAPFGQRWVPTAASATATSPPPQALPVAATAIPWRASACLDELQQRVDTLTESGDRAEFRILSRQGRWVVLEASRTSGVLVGTRLIGPGDAGLHVVRLGPSRAGSYENRDYVTAFVRTESAARPLAAGDVVAFDLRPLPPGR